MSNNNGKEEMNVKMEKTEEDLTNPKNSNELKNIITTLNAKKKPIHLLE